jgi:signal transduction histidine kinase
VRARRWIGLAAAAALLFTVLVTLTSAVRFAYRSPSLHVATETVAALVSLIAAAITHGRFRRTLQLRDLVLTASLAVLAVANLTFSAVPAIVELHRGAFGTWAAVVGRTLAAVLMSAAAVVDDRALRHPARSEWRLFGVCATAILAAGVSAALAADLLPVALPAGIAPESSDRPRVVGNPVVLAAQLCAVPMFAAAAVGFARRADEAEDALLGWFAVGATFAAFSWLNYFLFPSVYSDWFYSGDVLRLCFFASLLAGGVAELGRAQRGLAIAAVADERRRIGRELHDGMAQDLAFIVTQAKALARPPGSPAALQYIAAAAQRALDEARIAIGILARPADEPLADALERTAREAASREGVEVEVISAAEVCVPPETHQALERVVREAVINAVRHGGARTVTLQLTEDPELRLRVADDGTGFVLAPTRDAQAGRFGLRSMRERVDAIGGELQIHSTAGEGTEVLVIVP